MNSSTSTASSTNKNPDQGAPSLCPYCGSPLPPDSTCEELFSRAQLAELDNPAYYTVHHLSVPCYMLQHRVYTRRGWLEVRELLRRFIEEGLTPAEFLRHNRRAVDSGRRDWSFTRGDKMPGLDQIHWSMNISSVRLDTPDHYCDDVFAWAAAILCDTHVFIRGHSGT